MSDNKFIKKGYGRIYVQNESDISKVIKAIKKVDSFEAGYLVKNFITADQNAEIIYSGKFEIDIDKLTEYCKKKGIEINCVTQEFEDEFGASYYYDMLED